MGDERASGVKNLFDEDEVREVLSESFFREPDEGVRGAPRARRAKTIKPEHYEVICISLYKEDLEKLDAKVRRLKESGHRKMSRSALIRYALDTVDLDALPKAY